MVDLTDTELDAVLDGACLPPRPRSSPSSMITITLFRRMSSGRCPVVSSSRRPVVPPIPIDRETDMHSRRRRFQMPPLGSVVTARAPLPGRHPGHNQKNRQGKNHGKHSSNERVCRGASRLIRSPRSTKSTKSTKSTRSTGPPQRRVGGTSCLTTKPTPATGRRTRASHRPETAWV
jgi:hypothetical protein